MITAQLAGVRRFRLVEEELPEPGPGEVQVQVSATGICGSDMHSYTEGGVGDTPCEFPMVLGHEPAGVVVKCGTGVTGWSPGDRAALEPAIFCYHCEFCQTGRYNLCSNLRFMSSPGIPGFFRERTNVPARNLIPIPKEIGLAEATLIEPLAVALHSLRLGSWKAGETAAVVGTGPIGLLTVAALKFLGATQIHAIEPLPYRREMARAMGADTVLDPSELPLKTGVHLAFDCAAKDESLNNSIKAVRSGGRVVLTGIHENLQPALDVHTMRRREVVLFSVRRSNDEPHDARDMLASNPAFFAPLITHRRRLDQIDDAFSVVEHYSDNVGKMVVGG